MGQSAVGIDDSVGLSHYAHDRYTFLVLEKRARKSYPHSSWLTGYRTFGRRRVCRADKKSVPPVTSSDKTGSCRSVRLSFSSRFGEHVGTLGTSTAKGGASTAPATCLRCAVEPLLSDPFDGQYTARCFEHAGPTTPLRCGT